MKLWIGIALALTWGAFGASAFDKKFELYNQNKSPGFAALVLKGGKTIYEKGFGFTSADGKGVKLSSSSNFDIASTSKQFTAMAILLLEQAGKLTPDDPISKFLPNAPAHMAGIQIRHLLHHTSGLPDYSDICEEKPRVFNGDIIDALFKKPKLLFAAGSHYEYSNSGYVLLSEIVQRVSGKPYPDFVKTEIFDRLGMQHSLIFSEQNQQRILNRATGYGEWPFFEERDFSPCNYNYGDGGVRTTLADYKKWALFLQTPRGILKPKYRSRIFEPGNNESVGGKPYAYGWVIGQFREKKIYNHQGAWLGFRSFAGYLPEDQLWVVLFSNYGGIDMDETAKLFLTEFAK